jgi:hypothetical protein
VVLCNTLLTPLVTHQCYKPVEVQRKLLFVSSSFILFLPFLPAFNNFISSASYPPPPHPLQYSFRGGLNLELQEKPQQHFIRSFSHWYQYIFKLPSGSTTCKLKHCHTVSHKHASHKHAHTRTRTHAHTCARTRTHTPTHITESCKYCLFIVVI